MDDKYKRWDKISTKEICNIVWQIKECVKNDLAQELIDELRMNIETFLTYVMQEGIRDYHYLDLIKANELIDDAALLEQIDGTITHHICEDIRWLTTDKWKTSWDIDLQWYNRLLIDYLCKEDCFMDEQCINELKEKTKENENIIS